jgi:GDPmannose 4,6-dehydratase
MISQNLQETLYNKKIDTMNILNIFEAKKLKGNKNVIITGVTGQDGSYMIDFLLKNTNYEIFGGVRRLSVYNHDNIKHITNNRFHLVNFDLTDSHAISRTIEILQPDYFINFAAQSFVASSWDFARQTWETNSTAVLDILEAIRQYNPTCRFYNAGSSEEFGNVIYSPQDEKHPLRPRSPYAASKAAARQLVKVYRESYNLYVIQGWLYNHEGERRGEEFVTRKITKEIAKIVKQLKEGTTPTPIELGNVNAKRDWSYAPDFMDGVWRMLNQDQYIQDQYKNVNELSKHIKDYILASGENHTVKEFVDEAFKIAGIDGQWGFPYFRVPPNTSRESLEKLNCYIQNCTGIPLVIINPNFYRPAEVDALLGDSSLVRKELGWKPKTSFKEMVKVMVESDLKD